MTSIHSLEQIGFLLVHVLLPFWQLVECLFCCSKYSLELFIRQIGLSLFEVDSSYWIIRFGLQSIVTENRQTFVTAILLLQAFLIYICIVGIVSRCRRDFPWFLMFQDFFRTLYLLYDIIMFFFSWDVTLWRGTAIR